MSIKRTIKRHKAAVAAVLLCLVLACCGGAMLLSQTPGSGNDPQQQESEEETAPSEGDGQPREGEAEQEQEADNPSPSLSDEDKDRYKDEVKAYSNTARELQDLLNASVWTNGESFARFADGAATFKKGSGDSQTYPFVIKAVETSTSTADSSKSQVTTYVAAVELEGDSGLLTYKRSASTAVDFDLSTSTISCSLIFGNANEYTAQAQSESFSVANFSTEALSLLGGDAENIRAALSKWCSEQAPTATMATWDETLDIDYSTKLVKAPMTLDNSSKTKVTVIYDMVGGNITVKSGSN